MDLIPGYRQRADGSLYQYGRETDGTLVELPVEIVPLSAARAALYESVTVESQAYRAAAGITPTNPQQAKLLQDIIDRGPTYESLAIFQNRSL